MPTALGSDGLAGLRTCPGRYTTSRSRARFTIVTDGVATEVTSPLVLVANGSSIISPRLSLYPGIRTDDSWLDVLVFTPRTPLEIAHTLVQLALHGLAHSRYLTHIRARHIEITSDPA